MVPSMLQTWQINLLEYTEVATAEICIVAKLLHLLHNNLSCVKFLSVSVPKQILSFFLSLISKTAHIKVVNFSGFC